MTPVHISRSFAQSFTTVLITLALGSSLLSAQARDRIKPTAPTNLVVTAVTTNSVSLAWGPSTDNSGQFTYSVCCSAGGTSIIVSQTMTRHTVTGLESGKTYVFRVYARDAAGNLSSSSNPVTVTVLGQIAAPTKPEVAVVDVGPTHASLTWSSTDDGAVIWYTIYIDGQAVNTLNSRSGTFTPLDQDTAYTFTVRARDDRGNWSPFSDPVVVTTEPANPNDQTAPTQPTNITALSDGAFVNLQWDRSTDDLAPQSLIRYDVYVDGVLSAVVVGDPIAQVDVDYGVHTITIVAVDTADNESVPGTITIIH